MNDTGTLERTVPDQRPCTRCDGTQYLVATQQGLGKYRCDQCELAVGFDLEAQPVEFLLRRGLPSRYSKQWFGQRLAPQELRLDREVAADRS
ncbi:MAG: hypothetical protein KY462_11550 [Actinobacteria bacterium]|nr:hypothetical protein [Actinomycetota bacterium]